jgi:purine-binding chemotaxis protein CheW
MQTKTAALGDAVREPGENAQYLTFQSAGETFAVPIVHIREIIQYGDVTQVPMMPDYINGVIDLRGRVVPLIDLAARFDSGLSQVSRRTCIVIVEINSGAHKQSVGAMVDRVNEVIEVAAADIEPPPAFGTRIRTDFIAGMARIEGRFVVVLDTDRMLDIDELGRVGEALEAPPAP